MQCPICPKLHMFGKSPGLKTSTCQYSVIIIAPPVGSRKFGIYKWLWHIPPIFTTLKAYCPLFSVFLWPRDGGEPGCEGPFIAACSFNQGYFSVQLFTVICADNIIHHHNVSFNAKEEHLLVVSVIWIWLFYIWLFEFDCLFYRNIYYVRKTSLGCVRL